MERRLSYSPVLVKTVKLEGIVVDIRVPARNHQLIFLNKTIKNLSLGTANQHKNKKQKFLGMTKSLGNTNKKFDLCFRSLRSVEQKKLAVVMNEPFS